METPPKAAAARISSSSEVSQNNSSPASSVVRRLKTSPRYSDHTASSSNQAIKPSKHTTPKPNLRKSPNPQKNRRSGRVSELEGQICQIENDLKTVKDQLCSAEALKKQALEDVEESNKQLADLSLKLEESRKQISEKPALETPERVEQDSAALEEKLSESLLIVEDMKNELNSSRESESQARALVGETLTQLETAKIMVETLRSDGLKTTEDYNAVASEVTELKNLVSKLNADVSSGEAEVNSLKQEVEELRSALETEMRRSKDEVDELRASLMDKETELQGICEENECLEKKLQESNMEMENLRGVLVEKEEKLRTKAVVVNAEMEEELRKLKVQAGQWRKAAEAAAAMVPAGQVTEKTGSMDGSFRYGDDMDDDFKKRNGNVLKRIGVLWKKQQK